MSLLHTPPAGVWRPWNLPLQPGSQSRSYRANPLPLAPRRSPPSLRRTSAPRPSGPLARWGPGRSQPAPCRSRGWPACAAADHARGSARGPARGRQQASRPGCARVPAQPAAPPPPTPCASQLIGPTDDGKQFDGEDAQLNLSRGTPRWGGWVGGEGARQGLSSARSGRGGCSGVQRGRAAVTQARE